MMSRISATCAADWAALHRSALPVLPTNLLRSSINYIPVLELALKKAALRINPLNVLLHDHVSIQVPFVLLEIMGTDQTTFVNLNKDTFLLLILPLVLHLPVLNNHNL